MLKIKYNYNYKKKIIIFFYFSIFFYLLKRFLIKSFINIIPFLRAKLN